MGRTNLRTVTFWNSKRGWSWRVLGYMDELIMEGDGFSSKARARKFGIERANEYARSPDYRKARETKIPSHGRIAGGHKRSWRKIK